MRGERKLMPLGLVSTKKVNTLVYCLTLLFLFLWTENAFSAGRKSLIEVCDLKYQSNAGYERVVVYLSTGGSFTSHKLSEPRRFFIDLENARIGNSLKRHHQIMNGFLKTVRIGQFNRKTVRIVFDLEKNEYKEKISRLEDPPRLVIDIFPRNPMKQHALSVAEKTGSKDTPAGSPSLDEGLKAEGEGKWEKAIEIYKSLLKREPKRLDIWLRLADIEWHIGNKELAAEALKTATQLSPDDHVLYFRLSNVYSALDKPQPALDAVEKAVALNPNNKEYLEARAVIAEWLGKDEIASDSFKRILALSPDDKAAFLNLARSQVRREAFAEAVETFTAYYAKYPEDRDILNELERTGLQAELEGRWQDALRTYRVLIEKEPERVDLWVRIGNLEYSNDNYENAAQAFQKAAELSPNDPTIYFQLSQSFYSGDIEALDAIEKAIEIDPNNIEYLRAKAVIANWSGRPGIAVKSYKQILYLSPDDEAALLDLARSQSWNNELDSAARNYKSYLSKYPKDAEVLIEYVMVEGWRGNYPAALSLLERYREDFGETFEYQKQKAGILAWAERPTAATELILPLLEKIPDDYEVHFAHTVALHYANRPKEVSDSLQTLEDLRPDSQETYDIRRFVTTPLRSHIEGGFTYYHDSDSINIYYTHLKGEYALSPVTFLRTGFENDYLHADKGSGYEQIDGKEDIWHSRFWIGIRHRFLPKVAAEGDIGGSFTGDKNKVPTYRLAFDFQVSDELKLKLERDYGYFVISPRSLSHGIRIGKNRLQLSWTPDLKYYVEASGEYSTLSDDNKRWEIVLGPRRAFLRTGKFNLDIGITALLHGFEEQDLDHGYYSPELYQSYMISGFGYWKINDDNGVSVIISLGEQKDDTVDSFRFGFDASIEGTFGLYRDWMLVITGGLTHNIQQQTGAFDAVTAGVALTRRF